MEIETIIVDDNENEIMRISFNISETKFNTLLKSNPEMEKAFKEDMGVLLLKMGKVFASAVFNIGFFPSTMSILEQALDIQDQLNIKIANDTKEIENNPLNIN